MGVITLDLNPPMLPTSVPDLREAVGWGRMDADYPAAFQGYWATVAPGASFAASIAASSACRSSLMGCPHASGDFSCSLMLPIPLPPLKD